MQIRLWSNKNSGYAFQTRSNSIMVLCPFLSCPLETNDDLLLLRDLGPHPRLICLQLHKVKHDYTVVTRKSTCEERRLHHHYNYQFSNVCKRFLLKCYHGIHGEAHFNKGQWIFQLVLMAHFIICLQSLCATSGRDRLCLWTTIQIGSK